MRVKTRSGIILLVILLFTSEIAHTQDNAVKVIDETNSLLTYPWAGGMNSMQFGELDMNRNGIKDLIAFDREGNRKLCFINKGIPNTIDYDFRPEYAEMLPDLYDWAIFTDYNMDGKNDIFTYSPGYASMMVYKNISDDILKFERVVYPYLTSYQGGGHVNIYVTYADYPGISDIDNDGDLDILTFWGMGSFVEMHKNLSMEKYGIPDSLDYEQVTFCWGFFAENDESNVLYLDTCLGGPASSRDYRDDLRHTGSTFLMLDLDADNDKDLLLADVDYPNLFSLINGGTIDEAYITSFDTLFPSSNVTIKLFSMPAAAYIDVNNDTKKDLLVSPFDPSIIASENKQSVWLYINEGENNQPDFKLNSTDFLQAGMIDRGSGAYPVLYDWDKDGLLDLFVGNYGDYRYSYYENYFLRSVYRSRLAWYKNTGSPGNPSFQMFDNNFADLWDDDLLGIYPTFSDLNGDEEIDLLIGNEDGKILYAKNENGNFTIVNNNYFNIDVGKYSTPQLFDLDKDGAIDLVIGEKGGNINYYRNQGSNNNPDFVHVTDSLGKINVTDPMVSLFGYSTPWFFRDNQNNTHLIVGSEQGQLYYYTGIDGNLNGEFNLSDGLHELLDTTDISFDRGIRTAATIADISQNEKFEMIAGNYSGGLEYFNGFPEVSPGISNQSAPENLIIYPNPASSLMHISIGHGYIKTVSIYSMSGQLAYFQQQDNYTVKETNLDISSLISGIYILYVQSDSRKYIRKIVLR